MLIADYARHNFIVTPDDDENTIMLKRYYLTKDAIHREMIEREKQRRINEKTIELVKIRGTNSANEMKRALLADEIINEIVGGI